MSAWEIVRGIAIIGPIVLMVAVGLIIVVRSGEDSLIGVSTLKRAVGNLWQAVVMLAGWVIGLAMIQELIGFKMSLGW